MKKLILVIMLFLFITVRAQNDPCMPWEDCWCDEHPEECDHNPNVPIDQHTWIIIAGGITIAVCSLRTTRFSKQK